MANYTRRAANDVSQFLREGGLNSVHADEPQDDYPLPDADLDLFMNREFIDFDTGLSTNFKADSPTAPKTGEPVTAPTTVPDFGGMDFMSTGRFTYFFFHFFFHGSTLSCRLVLAHRSSPISNCSKITFVLQPAASHHITEVCIVDSQSHGKSRNRQQRSSTMLSQNTPCTPGYVNEINCIQPRVRLVQAMRALHTYQHHPPAST